MGFTKDDTEANLKFLYKLEMMQNVQHWQKKSMEH